MGRYKHILLVEDDADDVELFAEALKTDHPHVKLQTENNGYSALDILQRQTRHPDIIFIDQVLPIMDGYELLKELKKDPRLMDLPTVCLSTTSHRDRALYMLGADLCLLKPHSWDDLRVLIGEVLSHDLKKDKDYMRKRFPSPEY